MRVLGPGEGLHQNVGLLLAVPGLVQGGDLRLGGELGLGGFHQVREGHCRRKAFRGDDTLGAELGTGLG